mmetsp:Transcript_24210/g.72043  ORF Transcript_24210/g.72043 Transcript_24210/m.72043 type:complete len:210 (-) Transcript_24210:72-701(-)
MARPRCRAAAVEGTTFIATPGPGRAESCGRGDRAQLPGGGTTTHCGIRLTPPGRWPATGLLSLETAGATAEPPGPAEVLGATTAGPSCRWKGRGLPCLDWLWLRGCTRKARLDGLSGSWGGALGLPGVASVAGTLTTRTPGTPESICPPATGGTSESCWPQAMAGTAERLGLACRSRAETIRGLDICDCRAETRVERDVSKGPPPSAQA